MTTIGYSAFSGCTGLISVVIPDSVTIIEGAAFYGCTSLTSITLPFVGETKKGTSNTHFGYIFGASSYYDGNYVPSSLKEVIITGSTTIGDCAFNGCSSLTNIVIPDSVTVIGTGAFYGCTGLTSIIIDETNPNYQSIDVNLYSKDGKTLIQYAIGKTDTSFEIPNNVTTIGEYAFSGCDSLTSIVIPDSVTTIGEKAFYNCNRLRSIVIPDSVTSIGYSAFYDCDSLTDVYYTGTKEQWGRISIGGYNTKLTNATRHYNYVVEE